MSLIRRAWTQLLSIFRKRDLDLEFDREAHSHLAFAGEDYVQRGIPLAEAQRLARINFGSVEASKDAHRDSRGLPEIESFVYDLRFAFRGLRRDRAFTLTAIATLTLAIGLNTTVFAVMDTMLFRGLPLAKRPDRLVYIQERRPAGGLISYADFEDWRAEAKSVEGLAFVAESAISLKDGAGRPKTRAHSM